MKGRGTCYVAVVVVVVRIVTEVPTPSPLSSVTMLKDGSTLLAGSTDGTLVGKEDGGRRGEGGVGGWVGGEG